MTLLITNAHADNPGFEQLVANWGANICEIYYDDLDATDKTTYDDAMGVIVADCICQIDNTPYELAIERITSSAINIVVDEITKSVLDYTTLSTTDQAKLDAFNQLLIDKCW